MNDMEFEQDWKIDWTDLVSVVFVAALLSIPLLGWFLGLKYAAISLAEAIKRRRALIWLASLLAAVPVIFGVTFLARMGFDFRGDDALMFLLFAGTPIAHLTVTLTAIAVELRRNKVRRARRAELEVA